MEREKWKIRGRSTKSKEEVENKVESKQEENGRGGKHGKEEIKERKESGRSTPETLPETRMKGRRTPSQTQAKITEYAKPSQTSTPTAVKPTTTTAATPGRKEEKKRGIPSSKSTNRHPANNKRKAKADNSTPETPGMHRTSTSEKPKSQPSIV